MGKNNDGRRESLHDADMDSAPSSKTDWAFLVILLLTAFAIGMWVQSVLMGGMP